MPNGSLDYGSIFHTKTGARSFCGEGTDELKTATLNSILKECDVPTRSGNSDNPINKDWHYCPANIFPRGDVVDSTDKPTVHCTFHGTLVTTSTWKLIGRNPG